MATASAWTRSFVTCASTTPRDAARAIAPMKPAADAIVVNSTGMAVDEVVGAMAEDVRRQVVRSQSSGGDRPGGPHMSEPIPLPAAEVSDLVPAADGTASSGATAREAPHRRPAARRRRIERARPAAWV